MRNLDAAGGVMVFACARRYGDVAEVGCGMEWVLETASIGAIRVCIPVQNETDTA